MEEEANFNLGSEPVLRTIKSQLHDATSCQPVQRLTFNGSLSTRSPQQMVLSPPQTEEPKSAKKMANVFSPGGRQARLLAVGFLCVFVALCHIASRSPVALEEIVYEVPRFQRLVTQQKANSNLMEEGQISVSQSSRAQPHLSHLETIFCVSINSTTDVFTCLLASDQPRVRQPISRLLCPGRRRRG